MLHITLVFIEQLHQKTVRRFALDLKPIAIDAQKNIGRKERDTLVTIDKRMIFNK